MKSSSKSFCSRVSNGDNGIYDVTNLIMWRHRQQHTRKIGVCVGHEYAVVFAVYFDDICLLRVVSQAKRKLKSELT